MSFTSTNRETRRVSRFAELLPVVALAVGFGLGASGTAFAQHGGGGHGGGGGGFHGGGGGFHGGGNFHGGGYRGGGWHGGWGGWHGRGWGYGGWGWGGWAGYYPGFGFDPFWYGGYYDLESAPIYAPPPAPAGYPAPDAYDQQGAYGPQAYPATADGMVDNSRGFYRWQVGVENGSCNRPYLGQVVDSVSGPTTASFQPGQRLGGISVAPVIGGKVGARMDVTDQACATQALERTNTGTPVRWQTASGIPVTFTVTKTSDAGGRRCRDFTATATFASKSQSVNGYACKQTDGSWQTMR